MQYVFSVLISDNLTVKVSDFGTSREWEDVSTIMSFTGTVAWMAPEVSLEIVFYRNFFLFVDWPSRLVVSNNASMINVLPMDSMSLVCRKQGW